MGVQRVAQLLSGNSLWTQAAGHPCLHWGQWPTCAGEEWAMDMQKTGLLLKVGNVPPFCRTRLRLRGLAAGPGALERGCSGRAGGGFRAGTLPAPADGTGWDRHPEWSQQLPFGDLEGPRDYRSCLHAMELMQPASWPDGLPGRRSGGLGLHLPKRLVLSFPTHFGLFGIGRGTGQLAEDLLIIAAQVFEQRY